jgi:hypothetical protein
MKGESPWTKINRVILQVLSMNMITGSAKPADA